MLNFYKVKFSAPFKDGSDYVCSIDYQIASSRLGDKQKEKAVDIVNVVTHSLCTALNVEPPAKSPKYFKTHLNFDEVRDEMVRIHNAFIEYFENLEKSLDKDE